MLQRSNAGLVIIDTLNKTGEDKLHSIIAAGKRRVIFNRMGIFDNNIAVAHHLTILAAKSLNLNNSRPLNGIAIIRRNVITTPKTPTNTFLSELCRLGGL